MDDEQEKRPKRRRTRRDGKLLRYMWEPGAFIAKTSHLDRSVRDRYRSLLDWAFLHGRNQTDLPDDDRVLRAASQATEQEWPEVKFWLFDSPNPMFKRTDDGHWRNERLEEEVAIGQEASQAARDRVGKRRDRQEATGVASSVTDVSRQYNAGCTSGSTSSSTSTSSSESEKSNLGVPGEENSRARAKSRRKAKPPAATPVTTPDEPPPPPVEQWSPSPDRMAELKTTFPMLDVDYELLAFRNWMSKPKFRGKYTDYDQTFFNHLDREKKRSPIPTGGPSHVRRPERPPTGNGADGFFDDLANRAD